MRIAPGSRIPLVARSASQASLLHLPRRDLLPHTTCQRRRFQRSEVPSINESRARPPATCDLPAHSSRHRSLGLATSVRLPTRIRFRGGSRELDLSVCRLFTGVGRATCRSSTSAIDWIVEHNLREHEPCAPVASHLRRWMTPLLQTVHAESHRFGGLFHAG
jgi:hypothetical protein